MHAFVVSRDVLITTSRFTRFYKGGALAGEVPVDRLVVDSGGESELVRKEMEKQFGDRDKKADPKTPEQDRATEPATDEIKTNPFVTGIQETALLGWPGLPARLGRVSTRFAGPGLHRHDEAEPLPLQLAALKARLGGRRHFRIAVVNAFGTNLGDCTLGMTAMRIVADRLRNWLGSFVIDLMLGVNTSAGNFEIAGYRDWIGELKVTGPSLKEFSKYDAYFDFTGLITLPRFTELPIVDWYLWWFGLDADAVPKSEKRNQVFLRPEVDSEMRAALEKIERPRIVFNPKSSVTLRTCPDSAAKKILKDILAKDQKINVVMTADIDFKHERVHSVGDLLKRGTPYFNALISNCDGIISVDTYSVHASDAFDKPLVAIYASVPPDAYPYYPFHKGMLIPGGETLPAFKKSKVTDDEWKTIKDDYEAAWNKVDGAEVLEALRFAMGVKPKVEKNARYYKSNSHRARLFTEGPTGRRFLFEKESQIWDAMISRVGGIFPSIVRVGSGVVVVTPGQSVIPMALAEHVGAEGEIHIFEPRKYRRKLIESDLIERAPQVDVDFYDGLPLDVGKIELPVEDPLNETEPDLWGHSRNLKPVKICDFSTIDWSRISAVLIFAPVDFGSVIRCAKKQIEEKKTPIIFGPVTKMEVVKGATEILNGYGYDCYVEYLGNSEPKAMVALAVASSVAVKSQNMKKIIVRK